MIGPGRRAVRRLTGPGLALAILALASTALPVAVSPEPAAAAGTAPQDVVRQVLGDRPSTPLVLTGPVRRDGQQVSVPAQVVRTGPLRSSPTVVAADDSGELTARVQVRGTTDAPPRTAVLLVDASGSMAGPGVDAARRAAQVYATTVGREVRVGLVAFADTARVLTVPTTDRRALRVGIDRLQASGETALYDGLLRAVALAGPGGNVVLLSDGGDTVSRYDLSRAVRGVRAARTRVDVIAFKTGESAPAPLQQIAAAGRGRVVQAADAAGLGRAFAGAAAAVPLDLSVSITLPPGSVDAHPVIVGVLLGDRAYRAEVAVPAGAAPASIALPVERVPARSGPLLPWWVSALLGVVFAVAATVALWPQDPAVEERRRRRRALAAYGPSAAAEPDAEAQAATVSAATAGVLQASERVVGSGERAGAIAMRLDRAGCNLLPHEWVVLRSCLVLAGAAAAFLLVRPRWLGLLLGALIAFALSGLWLRVRQSRRCRSFAEQLPDTLQVIASSLRSGFSLQQAMAAAQETGVQPMASELGRALAAARIGVDLDEELERIAVRMRNEDWRMAAMAIRIQRSVGGNLADVLSTTARTLRDRSAIVRQVQALSAEGRLSAYVLLALPLFVGLFLLAFRRAYLAPLWSSAPGLVMLAVAGVGMVVGTWWMFKVAKVEV
jgi:tight adherence protein B